MGKASIKMYDKLGRVLRIETTANDGTFDARIHLTPKTAAKCLAIRHRTQVSFVVTPKQL